MSKYDIKNVEGQAVQPAKSLRSASMWRSS